MIGFKIDKIQAEYVAEIKLRHLNREYILKRLKDIDDLKKQIEDMEDILSSKADAAKALESSSFTDVGSSIHLTLGKNPRPPEPMTSIPSSTYISKI